MAESIINAGNTKITFRASSGGLVSVQVVDLSTTIIIGSGTSFNYNTSEALSNVETSLIRQANSAQVNITTLANKINEANVKLSQPDVTPLIQQQLRGQIAEFQKLKKEYETELVDANQALSYIQNNGANIFPPVVSKAKESETAAETAKPAPTTPAPAPANPPDKPQNQLSGPANDDSGAKQPNPAGSNGQAKAPVSPPPLNSSGGASPKDNKSSNEGKPAPSGAEPLGSAENKAKQQITNFKHSYKSTQSKASSTGPGKRLNNPLGSLSSYTYQISLYMMTPDAYDAFVNSGRTKLNILNVDQQTGQFVPTMSGSGGAFVIAQSGGINNQSEKRAPGFEFDYGIDNLVLKQNVSGKSLGSSNTNVYEMTFTITEPYGFSFMSNLKRAKDAVKAYTGSSNMGKTSNIDQPPPSTSNNPTPAQTTAASPDDPWRQNFVLGIRFFGYDKDGNLANANTQVTNVVNNFDATTGTTTVTAPLDVARSTGALFETFYDIKITGVKFKIDGKATQYHCEASNIASTTAMGVKYGTLPAPITVTGVKVSQCIESLLAQVNESQVQLQQKGTVDYPFEFEVIYLGNSGSIEEAAIASPADIDKIKWKSSDAQSTKDVNPSTETGNNTPPSTEAKIATFEAGRPIVECIDKIISQSQYLEDALKEVYNSTVNTSDAIKNTLKVDNPKPNYIRWYNCTPQLSSPRWDAKRSDWVWKITYLIQPYETPAVQSIYTESGSFYPGPHKRYNYWYTGQNSEVIQYEQNLDTAYFNTAMRPTIGYPDTPPTNATTDSKQTTTTASSGSTNVAQVPNMHSMLDRTGRLNWGLEAQNSFLTSLYDPGSYASANITIMGDPDFLMSESVCSASTVYDKFYNNDTFTINPNGGQIFVEINFNEAVDYDLDSNLYENTKNTGLMSINEDILFFKYPDSIAKKVKGVVHTLTAATHTFREGKFTTLFENATLPDFLASQVSQAQQASDAQSTIDQDTAASAAKAANVTDPNGATGNANSPPTESKPKTGTPPATNKPAAPAKPAATKPAEPTT